MAVTNRPSDKFAFLFSGSTSDQYIRDLEKVYDTLKNYYNYPKENIWVVEGGAALTGSFPDVVNEFSVPDKAGLLTVFSNFASLVQSNNAALGANEKNTVIIYFTGTGDSTAGIQKLIINSLSSINTSEFTSMVDVGQFSSSQVNVIMQQDYCEGFVNITDGLPTAMLIDDWSFTGACGIAQTNPLDDTGSAFTKAWVAGLRFETTPTLSYADQLLPANPAGYIQMISLEQAKNFADQKNSTTYVYNYSIVADPVDSTFKYLGRPALYIRDGDQQTIPTSWWESPDIYLHHPNHPAKADDDLYIIDNPATYVPGDDYNNTVCVKVRNVGTHPVRNYAIFIEVFRSGVGSPGNSVQETTCSPLGGVLKPVQKKDIDTADIVDIYSWNTAFTLGLTHECVRAEVQLDASFIAHAWDVTVNDFEAQRNTDISGDPPAPEGSKLHKLPGHSFRGITRHMYFIQNPFKETHQFYVTFPFNYKKHLDVVNMNWLLVCDKMKREAKLKFSDIDKETKGFLLEIKGGERKAIIFEFGFKHDAKLPKTFRIPMEILVDRIHGEKTRKPILKSLHGKYAAIAGLTVYLKRAVAHFAGAILDKKGNSIPNATIHLSTINGLQEETFKAGRHGKFHLEAINPDIYKIAIQAEGMKIHEQTLYLMEPKKHDLKFNLENTPKHNVRKYKK